MMQAVGNVVVGEVSLSDGQRARARSAAYNMFADFFREGPTAELADLLSGLDVLDRDVDQDPDAVASEHYALFGLEVIPYASWFLDPGGMLGGPVTETAGRLRARYLGDGRFPDEPDHVACELELLARLTGDVGPDDRCAADLRMFLDGHVLWWLPAFSFALRRSADGPYARVADALVDLVAGHRLDLGSAAARSSVLPNPSDILADAQTGVRDLAHYLATPALSGIVLVRNRLAEIGRALRLPRGFGDRRVMLANLLRSAAEYNAVADLSALIAKDVAAWKGSYEELGAQWPAAFAFICREWVVRLDQTASMLERTSAVKSN